MGKALPQTNRELSDYFIPEAFSAELLRIRSGFMGRVGKWWRIFSGQYRQAKAEFRGLLKEDLTGKSVEWLSWLDKLLDYRKEAEVFNKYSASYRPLFGTQWDRETPDWEHLVQCFEWLRHAWKDITSNTLPAGVIHYIANEHDLTADKFDSAQLESLYSETFKELDSIVQDLKMDSEVSEQDSIDDWLDQLSVWESNLEDMFQIVTWNQIELRLVKKDLGDYVHLFRAWPHKSIRLNDWINYSYYKAMIDFAYNQYAVIRDFNRIEHEGRVKDFVELDSSTLDYASESLYVNFINGLPAPSGAGAMEILRKEWSKKTRHMPIRRLLEKAGEAIQRIKPVFMMSPISVATYLPPGEIEFDLLIFDEASQIPAPEALGSIARCQQMLVVGDSKQMPPTSFFSKSVEQTDDEAEQSDTADMESILDLMKAKAPEKMLAWHYRSKHQSLIHVSNQQFYSNKLVIFPSAGANQNATGLHFRHNPNTHYDRSQTRQNELEAKDVAGAVIQHIEKTPGLSLGVVAFSTQQREAILIELEKLRSSKKRPEVERFLESKSIGEEFFIKNLENVQGDERDVIFISVGYGKTKEGKLSQNFGPLNKVGGERRLNVLMTRAKYAMVVFCNFKGDELRTDENSAFGLRALKAFLQYAESGDLPHYEQTGREPDSPFELEVKEVIESFGYEVHAQVGSAGYYIDLAIVDPTAKGRYMLAVECDGASYHSSRSARDRDRLRQAVLEDLGWRFHRVWSTDWFRNKQQEGKRLRKSIEEVIQRGKSQPVQQSKKKTALKIDRYLLEDQSSLPSYDFTDDVNLPSKRSIEKFFDIRESKIRNETLKILEGERYIHFEMLVYRLAVAAEVPRINDELRNTMEYYLDRFDDENDLRFEADFLKVKKEERVELKNWSNVPPKFKKFQYVIGTELEQLFYNVVQDSVSVYVEDAISSGLSMIGFKGSEAIKGRCHGIINGLLDQEILIEKKSKLVAAKGYCQFIL